MDQGHESNQAVVAEALPEREQADHEVAAGSVGGVCAGAVVWLTAMAATRGEGGFLLPLRLVATSLLGDAALDSGSVVGPVLHAAVAPLVALELHVLYGVLLGLLVPFLRRILR